MNETGSGYGDGDGSGSGCGYGDGSGSGCGYGDGSGAGDGYGDGYGYGSGYGYGYGSGDGYGYGSGDLKVFLDTYKRDGLVMAFWRSNDDGSPSNGGTGGRRNIGQIEEILGPLKICTKNGLHGTTDPRSYKGKRWWVVGLHPPVQTDCDKIASLKREIIADLGECPF